MLLESAIDISVVDKIPQGWMKMVFFADVEKLRMARKMVAFAAAHADRLLDVSSEADFLSGHEKRIEHNLRTLWPQIKPRDLKHWSAMNLAQRAELIGDPFDQIYNFHYPRLSLYVHPGLTGISNLPSNFFPTMYASAFSLVIKCYSHILEKVIHEMKINVADDKINDALRYATLLPFAKTREDEVALLRELLG